MWGSQWLKAAIILEQKFVLLQVLILFCIDFRQNEKTIMRWSTFLVSIHALRTMYFFVMTVDSSKWHCEMNSLHQFGVLKGLFLVMVYIWLRKNTVEYVIPFRYFWYVSDLPRWWLLCFVLIIAFSYSDGDMIIIGPCIYFGGFTTGYSNMCKTFTKIFGKYALYCSQVMFVILIECIFLSGKSFLYRECRHHTHVSQVRGF